MLLIHGLLKDIKPVDKYVCRPKHRTFKSNWRNKKNEKRAIVILGRLSAKTFHCTVQVSQCDLLLIKWKSRSVSNMKWKLVGTVPQYMLKVCACTCMHVRVYATCLWARGLICVLMLLYMYDLIISEALFDNSLLTWICSF